MYQFQKAPERKQIDVNSGKVLERALRWKGELATGGSALVLRQVTSLCRTQFLHF